MSQLQGKEVFCGSAVWDLSDRVIQTCLYLGSDIGFSSQVSCCEEEVHDRAEGSAAEGAESICCPKYHQPHHGGQVLPN